MKNIEVKYHIHSVEDLRRLLQSCPPIQFQKRYYQQDIYFEVSRGRLKVRIEDERKAWLIFYRRRNTIKPQISHYTLKPIRDLEDTLRQLRAKHKIIDEVEKTREFYRYKNVRIHLDHVMNLGWFVEFESVVSAECDEKKAYRHLQELLRILQKVLHIPLAEGYLDLILKKDGR